MSDLTIQFQQLEQFLENKNSFLIIAHSNPDGDTIGATGGLYYYLKQQNKKVQLFCIDIPDKSFQYLQQYFAYSNNISHINNNYDAIIVIDHGHLKLSGVYKEIQALSPQIPIINIDHHPDNPNFGTLNIIDKKASSACEIVTRFLINCNFNITAEIATSLLTGILTDTSIFSNPASSHLSIKIANYLLNQQADFYNILNNLFNTTHLSVLKIFGIALQRLQYNKKYNLAYTWLTAQDTEQYQVSIKTIKPFISNYLNNVVQDADIILILTDENKNIVSGSFRSLKTDVSQLAKLFNGGGHKLAAGFKIQGKIKPKQNIITIE